MRPLLLLALLSTGCATARMVGPAPTPLAPPHAQDQVLVLEPFFEDAEWEPYSIEHAYNGFANQTGQPVTVIQTYQGEALPLFDRTPALALEHERTVKTARALRPHWQVESTGALDALEGSVTLVRVVIGQPRTAESNRTIKDLGLGFGFLVLPLLVEITPVHEVLEVPAQLTVYRATAEALRPKRLRYQTQPDDAIDTRGLPGKSHDVVIKLAYEEGVLADEEPRDRLLVETLSDRLAAEIVKLADSP